MSPKALSQHVALSGKWNESGFRPHLCTYRLNWARRTSWGWWDDWDDTVLQTQDSKFEPWRSEAEHATSRSRFFQTAETGTLAWKAAVLTTTLGPPPTVLEGGWSYTKNVKIMLMSQYKWLCYLPGAVIIGLFIMYFKKNGSNHGQTSKTVSQHLNNIGSMSRVCWPYTIIFNITLGYSQLFFSKKITILAKTASVVWLKTKMSHI